MQRLERPLLSDQLGGQPVEQFGMARHRTTAAEIIGRGDQPLAKVVLPEPIDDHPGRQRMLGLR